MVQAPFRKDLSHITWDEVYARQVKRDHLVRAWTEALQIKLGDHILDVGAGPGYVSLALAGRVGPDGLIYAVDRSAEALAYLDRLQRQRGVLNIRRFVGDAATLEPADLRVNSALVTMVLHHADDPANILRNLARLLAPRSLAVVAEFHPDGPCEQGPPREHRLRPEQVQAWCEEAGFLIVSYQRQTPEHYMFLLQRQEPSIN